MKFLANSGYYRSNGARWSAISLRCLWAVAISAFSMVAHAEEQAFNQPDSSETPWNVLSTSPYVADPRFNQGLYKLDNYPTDVRHSELGRKIAHLGNGDVIVAGIAPRYNGLLSDPVINLVLERYDNTGHNVAWSNPGANGYGSNQRVVFPNSIDPSSAENVKDVLDIKVYGNRIFVLVDSRYHGSADDIDSRILVFGTDGAFLGSTNVLYSSKSEYSGGMSIGAYAANPEIPTIVIVASTLDGVWRPTMIKGTVNSNSSVSFNAPVFLNPANYCPSNRGCILRSVVRDPGAGIFYAAGTRQSSIPDNGNWDFLIMSFLANGGPYTAFRNGGVTTVAFDSGGAGYDDANAIQFGYWQGSEEIYVTGFVSRTCKDGIGVVKMTYFGSLFTDFGDMKNGKVIVGGTNKPPGLSCAQLDIIPATYANDAALSVGFDKLAIAGFSANSHSCLIGQTCPEDDVNSMATVIDTRNGNIDSFRVYPYADSVDGPRTRHSGFWGITESGNGTFTATGDVRRFQTATGQPSGPQQIATLRISMDSIYANGFE